MWVIEDPAVYLLCLASCIFLLGAVPCTPNRGYKDKSSTHLKKLTVCQRAQEKKQLLQRA